VSKRIEELGGIELTDNEALKLYLDNLRSMCHDLYNEVNWGAEILQQRLANVKGVRNTVRARSIAASLRSVGESFKIAAGGTVKTWTMFEQKFAEELEGSVKKPKEEFKIK
jgi:hypothetical protein